MQLFCFQIHFLEFYEGNFKTLKNFWKGKEFSVVVELKDYCVNEM